MPTRDSPSAAQKSAGKEQRSKVCVCVFADLMVLELARIVIGAERVDSINVVHSG